MNTNEIKNNDELFVLQQAIDIIRHAGRKVVSKMSVSNPDVALMSARSAVLNDNTILLSLLQRLGLSLSSEDEEGESPVARFIKAINASRSDVFVKEGTFLANLTNMQTDAEGAVEDHTDTLAVHFTNLYDNTIHTYLPQVHLVKEAFSELRMRSKDHAYADTFNIQFARLPDLIRSEQITNDFSKISSASHYTRHMIPSIEVVLEAPEVSVEGLTNAGYVSLETALRHYFSSLNITDTTIADAVLRHNYGNAGDPVTEFDDLVPNGVGIETALINYLVFNKLAKVKCDIQDKFITNLSYWTYVLKVRVGRYERELDKGRMFIFEGSDLQRKGKYDLDNPRTLRVDENTFKDYLGKGGTIESLYGAATSVDSLNSLTNTVDSMLSDKARDVRTYAAAREVYETSLRQSDLYNRRHAILGAVDRLSESLGYARGSAEEVACYEYANNLLKDIARMSNMSLDHVIIDIVCNGIHDAPMSADILRSLGPQLSIYPETLTNNILDNLSTFVAEQFAVEVRTDIVDATTVDENPLSRMSAMYG